MPNPRNPAEFDLDDVGDVGAPGASDEILDFELESGHADDVIEEALFDDAAAEALEEVTPEAELPVRFGRRAVAERARSTMHDTSDHSLTTWYGAGYLQALRDLGVDRKLADDHFGSMIDSVKQGLHGAGKLAASALEGALGGKPSFEAAAETAGKHLASRFGPSVSSMEAVPSDAASVEAEGSTLPPVYVEDEKGFEEDLASDPFGEELFGALPIEDRFGAVCRYGYVGSQPRRHAREAAHASVQGASAEIGKRHAKKKVRPFIEDPTARPVLFSDGRVWDAVYGALTPIPCPSCTRTPDQSAAQGSSQECPVCEQFGVFLVPARDLDTWLSSPTYGFLPLLVPVAKQLITNRELFPKAKEKLKALFRKKKSDVAEDGSTEALSEFDEEPEQPPSADAYEHMGEVRALVPNSWWERYQSRQGRS